jgi:flagellar biosynthesis regulator FlbT
MSKSFQVKVILSDGKHINPIIQANATGEAVKIAKAQYPDARLVGNPKPV